jgi:hypothetical protein
MRSTIVSLLRKIQQNLSGRFRDLDGVGVGDAAAVRPAAVKIAAEDQPFAVGREGEVARLNASLGFGVTLKSGNFDQRCGAMALGNIRFAVSTSTRALPPSRKNSATSMRLFTTRNGSPSLPQVSIHHAGFIADASRSSFVTSSFS